MRRLSLIDQVFHKIGSKGIPPIYMQGGMIVDPSHCEFSITAAKLAEHIASRMSKFDLLHKKLIQDPLKLGDVKMVDDPDFDVFNHITFTTLPKPGNFEQLSEAIGQFSAKNLGKDMPPWEFHIIDGLQGGRFCIFQKLSHATMDGMAAMKIMQTLFDTKPQTPDEYTPITWAAESEPSTVDLLDSAYSETVQRAFIHYPKALFKIGRLATNKTKESIQKKYASFSQNDDDVEIDDETEKKDALKPPRTSLNGNISLAQRRVAFVNYKIDKLKSLTKKLDCTLNDLCLLMISESLITYFNGVGEEVDGNLVIGLPMSVRDESSSDHGNKITIARINSHSANPLLLERLSSIKEQTQAAKSKRSGNNSGKKQDFSDVVDMISPIMIDALMLLLDKVKPWSKMPLIGNTSLSNVPGSRESAFFAGMPVDCSIPMVPIAPTVAVNFGVTSMGGTFSFGIHCCGEVVAAENLHYFIDGLNKAYLDLQYLAKNPDKPASSRRSKKVDALISSSFS